MSTSDLASAAGVLIMLAGLWLAMRWHGDTWEMEEAVKNGKLSAGKARRRVAWLKWRAAGLITGGLSLLAGAIWTLGG